MAVAAGRQAATLWHGHLPRTANKEQFVHFHVLILRSLWFTARTIGAGRSTNSHSSTSLLFFLPHSFFTSAFRLHFQSAPEKSQIFLFLPRLRYNIKITTKRCSLYCFVRKLLPGMFLLFTSWPPAVFWAVSSLLFPPISLSPFLICFSHYAWFLNSCWNLADLPSSSTLITLVSTCLSKSAPLVLRLSSSRVSYSISHSPFPGFHYL